MPFAGVDITDILAPDYKEKLQGGRVMRVYSILATVPLIVLLAACDSADKTRPASDYTATKITDKVYVIHTTADLPSPQNRGFINNPGIILTGTGVVVIDPGSSAAIGKIVLAKIKTLTDKPVITVFNTHIHGDHWLGNGVIKAAYPTAVIYAHPEMKALAEAGEGDNWIKILDRITKGAIKGTKPRAPDMGISDGETLKLGGVRFRIYHNGKAHTDNDIMIEVVEEGVIFLGDNVLNGRIGRMIDGNIKGNIDAIEIALKTRAKHFVPGHGQSGDREVAQTYLAYFKTIYTVVKKYAAQDLLDYEIKPKVVAKLDAYKNWLEFDNEVGRHVNYAYSQIQDELF